MPDRLLAIHREVPELIRTYAPDAMAVEALFFGRNVTTALTVGQARGVVLLAAAQAGLPIFEYKPAEVKQALSGYGGAASARCRRWSASCWGWMKSPVPTMPPMPPLLPFVIFTANACSGSWRAPPDGQCQAEWSRPG